MPFNPRLFDPELAPAKENVTEDAKLQWKELAQLGKHLRDDAQQLAQRYPAKPFIGPVIICGADRQPHSLGPLGRQRPGRSSASTSLRGKRTRFRWWASTTATLLLVAGVLAFVGRQPAPSVSKQAPRSGVGQTRGGGGSESLPHQTKAEWTAPPVSSSTSGPSKSGARIPIERVEMLDTPWREYSGPELEAVLDLWERSQAPKTSVSI